VTGESLLLHAHQTAAGKVALAIVVAIRFSAARLEMDDPDAGSSRSILPPYLLINTAVDLELVKIIIANLTANIVPIENVEFVTALGRWSG